VQHKGFKFLWRGAVVSGELTCPACKQKTQVIPADLGEQWAEPAPLKEAA
jgi:hypothetical protein